MNVVFIASLSHSGSTLLDLLLGNHPRLIGLGEVYKVINLSSEQLEGEKNMRCTCGECAADCRFWGPAISDLQQQEDKSLPDRYRVLLRNFQNIFGENSYLVDSSKYGEPFSMLASMENVQLKAIHLLKDVRSFTISQRDALPAEMKYGHLPVAFGSQALSSWLYSQSLKSPSYLFWKWYLRNRAAQKRIQSSVSEHSAISYEELSLSTEASMQRLFNFLDLDATEDISLAPKASQSHIFMGNQMIADKQKMQEIQYDKRWLSRNDWKLPAALFPNIMAYNSRYIYSRIAEKAIL
jgi:hypothetical protein